MKPFYDNCYPKDCCHNDPCGGCKPARYSQGFPACPDPFSGSDQETDTTLSLNYGGATLNYNAERHTDTITGTQLGSIINLGDLRDVNTDSDTDAMCSELIYHKYGDCGEGCRSLEDSWTRVSIDDEGILKDNIRYVRGANVYGCPEYLNVPSNTNEYWFAGWRANGDEQQFGYYQAEPVDELPTDENGDTIVISQDPNTKQPIVGSIPLNCILSNIVGNLGMNVYGTWSKVQETPQFTLAFNNITGDFTIKWSDWNDLQSTQRAGYGVITGNVDWESSFDVQTGSMVYKLNSVYFNNATWTKDQGVTQPTRPSLTVSGVAMPSGELTQVLSVQNYGEESWSQTINITIPCNQTITVAPAQTIGPLNFAYIHVDWILDDEGYEQINFANTLSGWKDC